MSKELIIISPEGLEVANLYLELGSIAEVTHSLQVSQEKIVEILNKREVKSYIDTIYLDQGYRNKNKIAALLDRIIESKIVEAEESEIYSTKDLVDILKVAHTMRMDEHKLQNQTQNTNIKHQTNVQINDGGIFGAGTKYGELISKLMKQDVENGN